MSRGGMSCDGTILMDGEPQLLSSLAATFQTSAQAPGQALQHEQERLDIFERVFPEQLLTGQFFGLMRNEHATVPTLNQIQDGPQRHVENAVFETSRQRRGRQPPQILDAEQPQPGKPTGDLSMNGQSNDREPIHGMFRVLRINQQNARGLQLRMARERLSKPRPICDGYARRMTQRTDLSEELQRQLAFVRSEMPRT